MIRASFSISRELLGEIESYIDEHYVAAQQIKRRKLLDEGGPMGGPETDTIGGYNSNCGEEIHEDLK